MNTKQIADRLVGLCRKGDFDTAQKELYAQNAVSIEPEATPQFAKETAGLQAIVEKGDKFANMVESYHEVTMSEPLIAGNSFAGTLYMDLTMKAQGRMQISELCVYSVKDGKIIAEQFFM